MSRPLQRTALREADQARDIAQLAQNRRGRDWADAVLVHQRLTAELAARPAGQLAFERDELALDLVDDGQRDGDALQGGGRQLERVQERAPVGPQELVGD